MAQRTTTILRQLEDLLPLKEFERFVGQHKADRYMKKLKCHNQLTIMLYAQATGKDSLREIETGLQVMDREWYHLGLESAARSTIAYANANRPWQIYESMFYAMLEKCQDLVSGTACFSFKNDLYALDASVIDLCLNLFPWAKFRKTKGAIKLHALFNIRSQIPELIKVTEAKEHEINMARDINLSKYPKGSIFVFDRAYNDYSFLYSIKKAGHHFVIRLKKNANIMHLGQHRPPRGGVLKDEKVAFVLDEAEEAYPEDLRLVTFYDEEDDKIYQFLTDEFRLSALNIAEIYRQRWQIELFFKWIKQHLKIKTFLGTSKNAVLTQIWIAMIYYLLLAWIKFQTKFRGSLLKLTILVNETILHHVHLLDILSLTPRTIHRLNNRGDPQLALC